jgi:biopolymer transport protein ExbB
MFFELIEPVYLFLERGGSVLYAIMGVVFLICFLVLERMAYLTLQHRPLLSSAVAEWEARSERKSWRAHQIRRDLLCTVESALDTNMSMIRMLVGLCPLFGLLGTVSGMIDVFDVMALMGSSSPKAMAAGISKATIPTMAGMVGALVGLFAASLLDRKIRREKVHLEEMLTFDH